MPSKYLDEGRQARRARYEYEFDDRLAGRSVLVAGGGGGLGAAVCGRLMRAGADIVLGYASDGERAIAIKSALEGQYEGAVRLLKADITVDEGRARILEEVDDARR